MKVTLDFETYFDQDYSLKKMPTVLYVRDPRFKVHCLGLKIEDQPTELLTGAAIAERLYDLPWDEIDLIGHNLYFDGMILVERFDLAPRRWEDTLSACRALLPVGVDRGLGNVGPMFGLGKKVEGYLDEGVKGVRDLSPEALDKLGRGCIADCDMTWALHQKLWPMLPEDQRELVHMTTRMGVQSRIELDQGTLREEIKLAEERRKAKVDEAGRNIELLSSNDKFLELLRTFLPDEELPWKKNDKGQVIPAFAKNDAEWVRFKLDNPDLVPLCEAREAVKSTIHITRPKRYLKIAQTAQGTLPMAYNFYGAHTGRPSGADGLNVANLPNLHRSKLRLALMAPEGHVINVADSSQIELREQLWFSGQSDLLKELAEGGDPYSEVATGIFGRTVTKADKIERGAGKATLLGGQYGMGPPKYRAYMAGGPLGIDPIFYTLEEARHNIAALRAKIRKTVDMWRFLDDLLPAMHVPNCHYEHGPFVFLHNAVQLPNGMYLDYAGLRPTEEGGWAYGTNGVTKYLWGGTLLENCLAEGTLVLTDSGWKPIEQVTRDDLVHDGVGWTTHGGSLLRSPSSTCTIVDGVYMTPDHEVLTDEGWKPAASNPRPYRPTLRDAHGACPRPHQEPTTLLDFPLRLREQDDQERQTNRARRSGRTNPELRLPDTRITKAPKKSRHVLAPGLLGVAQHARSLPTDLASSVEKLRRTGHHCMRALGGIVRSLLGGHGPLIPTRAHAGPHQQHEGIRAGELPLGHAPHAEPQPTRLAPHRHPLRRESNRDQPLDAVLPMASRPVYDILNAGPRQRFVVLGDGGPFVVHNCIQALAWVTVSDQALIIDKEVAPVVGWTYDEILIISPENQAEDHQACMIEIMSMSPEWGPDLPLAAEGGFDRRYSK